MGGTNRDPAPPGLHPAQGSGPKEAAGKCLGPGSLLAGWMVLLPAPRSHDTAMLCCEAQLLTSVDVHVHDCIHVGWDDQRQAQLAHPHDLVHELQAGPDGVVDQLPPILSTPALSEYCGRLANSAIAYMSPQLLPAAFDITMGWWVQYSEVDRWSVGAICTAYRRFEEYLDLLWQCQVNLLTCSALES